MIKRATLTGALAFVVLVAGWQESFDVPSAHAKPNVSAKCASGTTCDAAAPTGWTGPVLFYSGTAASPACPATTTVAASGGTGLTAPGATCSTCTCGMPSGGMCPASKQSFTIRPPLWTTNAEVCAPSGTLATCGAGVCAPSAPGFRVCIRQAGDVACPAGAYASKLSFDTITSDTRSCTACTCGAGSTACPASGGQPTGAVTTSHVTVCCM